MKCGGILLTSEMVISACNQAQADTIRRMTVACARVSVIIRSASTRESSVRRGIDRYRPASQAAEVAQGRRDFFTADSLLRLATKVPSPCRVSGVGRRGWRGTSIPS